MSLNEAVEAIPRKTMVLFFLVDTSGSMGGSKIGAVNAAIEEVIPELKDLSAANADARIKIAALEFSSGSRWVTAQGPEDIELFRWQYLDAGGSTDMGDAFRKLNEKLSIKAFMKEATGSFAPALFLLSDGEPTDDFDIALDELKQNNWFKKGIKVAVSIGDDANKGMLAKFTGSTESVLEVHSSAMLRKMIRFVSIRASEVASKSVQAGVFGTAGQASTNGGSAVQASVQAGSAAGGANTGIVTPTISVTSAVPMAALSSEAGGVPAASVPETTIKQQILNEQLKEMAAVQAASNDDEW
ncbi:vWA domain-containing protein [Treponema primitia]|uniref:vWA domain-containing protein n=1 Tax=Treponema primitia TaxID=88058 RepID=UPI0002555327|nr:VWA domain-containing protein [Treponema primitia]